GLADPFGQTVPGAQALVRHPQLRCGGVARPHPPPRRMGAAVRPVGGGLGSVRTGGAGAVEPGLFSASPSRTRRIQPRPAQPPQRKRPPLSDPHGVGWAFHPPFLCGPDPYRSPPRGGGLGGDRGDGADAGAEFQLIGRLVERLVGMPRNNRPTSPPMRRRARTRMNRTATEAAAAAVRTARPAPSWYRAPPKEAATAPDRAVEAATKLMAVAFPRSEARL